MAALCSHLWKNKNATIWNKYESYNHVIQVAMLSNHAIPEFTVFRCCPETKQASVIIYAKYLTTIYNIYYLCHKSNAYIKIKPYPKH